jgi:hypothetical protein
MLERNCIAHNLEKKSWTVMLTVHLQLNRAHVDNPHHVIYSRVEAVFSRDLLTLPKRGYRSVCLSSTKRTKIRRDPCHDRSSPPTSKSRAGTVVCFVVVVVPKREAKVTIRYDTIRFDYDSSVRERQV